MVRPHLAVLDDIAELTVCDDVTRVRTRYQTDERLRSQGQVLRYFPELVEDTVAELIRR